MCLMPLPVKIKEVPTTKAQAKTNTATTTTTTITPPRIVLDPHQNPHLHRIAMLPPHIKTTSTRVLSETPAPVPVIYLTTHTPTSTHGFEDEDEFMNLYPGFHPSFQAGVKETQKAREKDKGKEKEKARRRSSILRDIEFIKLVSEGVGSLCNSNTNAKENEKEKEKKEDDKKMAAEKKMIEVMGGLKEDVKFLKEGWVRKEREKEVRRVSDVARAEGKADGVREGVERIRGELERKERDLELEILRREVADANRRDSWGRRDSYGFGNHHGNANGIENQRAARMLWHFHTHANIGSDGRVGIERNNRRRRDGRTDEHERNYHHPNEYERIEIPYEWERRRSSLVSLRSLRVVVDRVARRDRAAERDFEAEILEREAGLRDERRERRRLGRRRRVDFDS